MNNSSIELRLTNIENSLLKIFEILGRDPQEFSSQVPNRKNIQGDKNRISSGALPDRAQKSVVENYERLSKEARKHGIQFSKGRDARDSYRRLKIAIEDFNTKSINQFFEENYITLCTIGGSDGLVLRKEHFFPSNMNYKKLLADDRIFNIKRPQEYLSTSFPANTVRIGNSSELQSIEEEEIELTKNQPPSVPQKKEKAPRKKRTKKETPVSEEALFSKLTKSKRKGATVKTANTTRNNFVVDVEENSNPELSYGQILDILDLEASNSIEEANNQDENYDGSSDDFAYSDDEQVEEKGFFDTDSSEDELQISYGSDDEE